MSEEFEVYDLKGKFLGIEDRTKFYKKIESEFGKKGKITKKIKNIMLLLLNSKGKIFVQFRNDDKERNPGLLDKSIGGHLKVGHSWNLTVVKECHEELGFPAVVLDDNEFSAAIKSTDLRIIGIVRKVEHVKNFLSINNHKGNIIKQPFITSFYVGHYDGPISFRDGESTGIRVFTLKELNKEIKQNPTLFTEDLKFMIKRYEHYLRPIKDITDSTVKGFEEKKV